MSTVCTTRCESTVQNPPLVNIFQPALGNEELEAVLAVFRSNWPGKGPQTDEFEARLARRFGVAPAHVCSVNSCTAGLALVAQLLDWKQGDDVVLPSISFVGTANVIAACGARPVFADVDRRTLNLTIETLDAALTPKTKAVILLHYGGVPCAQFDEIIALCRRRRITLIEDNACSPFSTYRNRACGTLGDFGLWSFDAMKILVTGDGGLVYAKRAEDTAHIEKLAYLGLESPSGLTNTDAPRWWEFDISCFGGRQITNDIASAIGLEQLKKVDRFLARRRDVYETYDRELEGLADLQTPPPIPAEAVSSYYLYWVQTDDQRGQQTSRRDEMAVRLRAAGIYTTFRYYPLHRVSKYAFSARLPGAEAAARRTLCLPLHQSLSDDDVNRVIEAVKEFARS